VETHINNYDLRWEHYFPLAQFYSASLFYKKFTDAIEQFIPFAGSDSRTVGFANVDDAYNFGIELEARKNFDFVSKKLENLVAYMNLSFIKSQVNQQVNSTDSSKRPLQGQSPYIFNGSLQYNEPKTELAFSVLYNVIGPRISLVGGKTDNQIWEKPHAVLDFKVQKTLLKEKGLIELTFSDILHGNDYQYWNLTGSNPRNYNSATDHLILQQSFGFNVTLAASYKIY
jgi:outer membrane receptor protein involved in Fe transport